MEVAQVPTQHVDSVEPLGSGKENDKGAKPQTEVEASSNNNVESFHPTERVKTPEAELVPHASIEESRPVDLAAPQTNVDGGDTHVIVSEPPHSPHTSTSSKGGADFVTPAGTVEAPICSTDTATTEVAEKEKAPHVKTASEVETTAPVVGNEPEKVDLKVEPSVEYKVEHSVEPKVELKIEQQEVTAIPLVAAEAQAAATTASSTEPLVETIVQAPAPSPGKKAKHDKKQANSDSFASEEVLDEVQKFLILQIVENRCSSSAKEINEFMEKRLNEKQRKRYVAPLVERIVQQFAREAAAKSEEVSVDVQSNICLIEQMFLTLGRRSPLEDMYTAEEEEMLDLLFHSNSSDDLPIDI